MASLCLLLVGVLASFGSLTIAVSAQVSCTSCIHVNMSFHNLPEKVSEQLNMMLSSLSNPGCVKDTAQKFECQGNSVSTRTKCMTSRITAKFVGMENLYPEAVMEQKVLLRGCAYRPVTEPDKCISFDQLDSKTKATATETLEQARAQWENLTYTGEACFEGDTPGSGSGFLFNIQPFLLSLLMVVVNLVSKQ